MLEIDGCYGEGGGQILRNAAAYAALLGQSTRITNIRAKRDKPGLKAQHLTGLQLLVEACGGSLEGGDVGSQEITIHVPDNRSTDSHTEKRVLVGDTHTAGSICLLLQAALPYALFAPSEIQWVLKGGTNATMAPQYDYWDRVFRPILIERMKLSADAMSSSVIRRGYFPRGGGEVHVTTKPQEGTLPPIQLTERGEVDRISIRAFHAGKCHRSVAERMASAAKQHLEAHIPGLDISSEIVFEEQSIGSASGILVTATTDAGCKFGGSALGSPKTKPSQTGLVAANEIIAALNSGGCVDEYLQDQLICYMALAEGVSEMTIGSLELHTNTAIWLAEKCTGAAFEVVLLQEGDENSYRGNGGTPGKYIVRCKGIGFSAPHNGSQTKPRNATVTMR